MDRRNEASFARAAAEAVRRGELAGIVGAATTSSRIILESAHGWRDHARSEAMDVDTVMAMASMTKTVTAVAALQLVERGLIALDQPVGEFVPWLGAPQVMDGVGPDGSFNFRPARTPITLRHLLSHSSGLGHETWSGDLLRHKQRMNLPLLGSQTNASLETPLLFEPGTGWQYSIGLEWTGKVIEAISGETLGGYLGRHVTGPLGMADTQFGPLPRQRERLAGVFQREADGSLSPRDFAILPGEYESGGGGLYGTVSDYLVFLRMLLNRGRLGEVEILRPETIELMESEQIASLSVARMATMIPRDSYDFEPSGGLAAGWNLAGLILREASPHGRPAGSWGWGGLTNCYFWLDRDNDLAGIVASQLLPFGDQSVLRLFSALERDAYARP
jgi:methyl acetate hydrolase